MAGTVPQALLGVIGRGAHRPSEMASRLGTTHANLTRPLELLRDASLIVRETPFGESTRSTKRTLYRIADPALRFWFAVQQPHQTRWRAYVAKQKRELVHQHASIVFEEWVRESLRAKHPDVARYWERTVELDVVFAERAGLVVGEVKFQVVTSREKERLLTSLRERFARSSLAAKHSRVRFEVFDTSILARPTSTL